MITLFDLQYTEKTTVPNEISKNSLNYSIKTIFSDFCESKLTVGHKQKFNCKVVLLLTLGTVTVHKVTHPYIVNRVIPESVC